MKSGLTIVYVKFVGCCEDVAKAMFHCHCHFAVVFYTWKAAHTHTYMIELVLLLCGAIYAHLKRVFLVLYEWYDLFFVWIL